MLPTNANNANLAVIAAGAGPGVIRFPAYRPNTLISRIILSAVIGDDEFPPMPIDDGLSSGSPQSNDVVNFAVYIADNPNAGDPSTGAPNGVFLGVAEATINAFQGNWSFEMPIMYRTTDSQRYLYVVVGGNAAFDMIFQAWPDPAIGTNYPPETMSRPPGPSSGDRLPEYQP